MALTEITISQQWAFTFKSLKWRGQKPNKFQSVQWLGCISHLGDSPKHLYKLSVGNLGCIFLALFCGHSHLEMQLLKGLTSAISAHVLRKFFSGCQLHHLKSPPRSCRCLAIHLQTFLPGPAEMESSCEDPRQTWWSIWAFKKITQNFWYAPQEFVHHNKYVYVYKNQNLFKKYNKHVLLIHSYIIYR